MDIDSFDLLVRALHREFIANPKCISVKVESLFYPTSSLGTWRIHVFKCSGGRFWITIESEEYEYKQPGFWSFKENRIANKLYSMLKDMYGGTTSSSTEQVICKNIPTAKDIIAERSLLNDNKD